MFRHENMEVIFDSHQKPTHSISNLFYSTCEIIYFISPYSHIINLILPFTSLRTIRSPCVPAPPQLE